MFRLFFVSTLFTIAIGASFQRELVPIIHGRIVGGKPTTIEENPWQISMRHFGSHHCGGSIVSPTKIVTAAHCIRGTFLSFVNARVGSSFARNGGAIVDVIRMVIHESYNIPIRANNDVGLLFLAQGLSFGPTMQPVALPVQNERVRAGAMSVVSGWGALIENGESPNQLQVIAVPIIDDNVCYRAVQGIAVDTMICAGNYENGGIDSCQGDSGGPLTIDGVLHGVVSGGDGCARPKLPGIYARASSYRQWIDNNN